MHSSSHMDSLTFQSEFLSFHPYDHTQLGLTIYIYAYILTKESILFLKSPQLKNYINYTFEFCVISTVRG